MAVEVTVQDVRARINLSGMTDEEIDIHLQRAKKDFDGFTFATDFDKQEAIACKAIYYIAPLLWSKISKNLSEFGDYFESFKDVEGFQKYWLERSNSVSTEPVNQKNFYYGAVEELDE